MTYLSVPFIDLIFCSNQKVRHLSYLPLLYHNRLTITVTPLFNFSFIIRFCQFLVCDKTSEQNVADDTRNQR